MSRQMVLPSKACPAGFTLDLLFSFLMIDFDMAAHVPLMDCAHLAGCLLSV